MSVAAPSRLEDGLMRLGGRPPVGTYLKRLWSRRQLALSLPLGELRAQNMDTALGSAWHLLNPLLLLAVYWLVFGVILKTTRGGTDNFIAFLTCGLFPFFFTRKSIQTGAKAIVANLGLIRSLRFPRAVLPVGALIGETLAYMPAIAAMLALVLITREPVRSTWLLLLPIVVLQMMFNQGLAFFVARLTDAFKDVQQLIPYAMTIWMYLSGVLYDAQAYVDHPLAFRLFQFNPAYAFVTMVRDAVLHGTVNGQLWMIAAGWSVLTLIVGFLYFFAYEQRYGRA